MGSQVAEALPRVSGHHRDKALAAARRARAVELKTSGLSYQQVADELGYQSRGTVYRIIQDAVASKVDEAVEDYRAVEVSRLNELQAALWPAAMEGDLEAATAIVKIIDARCKVLGLVAPRPGRDNSHAWDNCAGPSTVIVREDDCRHARCEKHGSFERSVT